MRAPSILQGSRKLPEYGKEKEAEVLKEKALRELASRHHQKNFN
jgi:hypothetical protein